ncbi:MAG: hypothetical protein ABI165_01000, partial [Bryobacteraceae bacterium]
MLLFLLAPLADSGQDPANLIVNGSFENPLSQLGWQIDPSAKALGSLALSSRNVMAGRQSLALSPSALNADTDWKPAIYGAGQAISATALQGHQLYLTAWMQADAGSVGIIRIYALSQKGIAFFQELRQPPAANGPVFRRDVLQVPNDPQIQYLLIGCMVEGTSGAAYFDDISLIPGVPSNWLEANGTPDAGDPMAAMIAVNANRHGRHIPATLYGTNLEWPDDGDGAWNEQTGGLDSSLVSFTRQLGTTLERFPGGIFSDFYSWRNGVGPQAARPATATYPGGPVRAHHFGTDEALAFAQATNGQLLITVNVVTGTPADAAAWVAHVNGGGRRVQYWEIGNESYAGGGSGAAAASSLTPEVYANRYLQFAQAMRAADPGIKIGAIMDENYAHTLPRSYPDWTDRVLSIAGSQIDFLSVHCGYAPVIANDLGWNPRTVYAAMLAAPLLIQQQLTGLSSRVAALLPNRAAQMPIAVTEWGPAFQGTPDGRFVDHTKTLGSGLFVADTLKAFMESPQTQIANLFKLADANYMGTIGMRGGEFASKASYLALQMFSLHFGSELVATSTQSPTYDSPTIGWVD